MIVANCNVQPDKVDHNWWADIRKLVMSVHTDCRNNVIKKCAYLFEVSTHVLCS
jgi:hypothetical protein